MYNMEHCIGKIRQAGFIEAVALEFNLTCNLRVKKNCTISTSYTSRRSNCRNCEACNFFTFVIVLIRNTRVNYRVCVVKDIAV